MSTFTEQTVEDVIEVLSTGHIQVRLATIVYRDEQELTRSYHRFVIEPGSDLSQYSDRIQRIAAASWSFNGGEG